VHNWLYGPLAVALALAVGIELRTGRIPKQLSLVLFVYLLATRMALGPEDRWQYWASVVLAGVIVLGVGWPAGYMGGGVAKLAIAVAAALVPWMALAVCGVLVFVCVAATKLLKADDTAGPKTMPGSVALAVLTAVVVIGAAIAGATPGR
jgi:hypothetical protein